MASSSRNDDTTETPSRECGFGDATCNNDELSYPATTTCTAATGNGPLKTTTRVPALGFGLYKVPSGEEGVRIVSDAILRAGYRHLDSASIYGNEKTVGRALEACCRGTKGILSAAPCDPEITTTTTTTTTATVERSEIFVASKVWNDAQKEGRTAVRRSVEQSLDDLGLDYLDLCYVHWPVPGCFVGTYRELLLLQKEGKIRFLGISNFRIADYEELLEGIPGESFVPPLVHQLEVSPFLYRPETIRYFGEEKGMLVAASKALNRITGLEGSGGSVVRSIAESRGATPARVLLRWGIQKGLVVLSKTNHLPRMEENRDLFGFSLSPGEMEQLDGITTEAQIKGREELEARRRTSQ